MSLLSPKVFGTLDCVCWFSRPRCYLPLAFSPTPSISGPVPSTTVTLSRSLLLSLQRLCRFLSLTFEKGRYDFGCRHSQIDGSYISSVTDETG